MKISIEAFPREREEAEKLAAAFTETRREAAAHIAHPAPDVYASPMGADSDRISLNCGYLAGHYSTQPEDRRDTVALEDLFTYLGLNPGIAVQHPEIYNIIIDLSYALDGPVPK